MTLKELYHEVVEFFISCGGIYANPPESTYTNMVDALANNRYIIHREGGKIVRALMYWRIREEDLEAVKHGGRPEDRESGTIIYLCEHAGRGKGLYQAVRELKEQYGGDACWHDRYTSPDRFRYYRRR